MECCLVEAARQRSIGRLFRSVRMRTKSPATASSRPMKIAAKATLNSQVKLRSSFPRPAAKLAVQRASSGRRGSAIRDTDRRLSRCQR